MKISECWDRYREYTRDLTEHTRKLAFASAAICWFFKTENFTFPPLILWSLTFVVGFFMADVTQYLIAALTTKWFARNQEIKAWKENGTVDIDVEVPDELDRPVFRLFIVKFLFLMASFVFLIGEFLRRIFC